MQPPSVLILTRNEQVNIADCLRCLSFTDDIVILDSCSTDQTTRIAERFPNVRIFSRPFDTEYAQRNHGLHNIPYKHPWLYICDADERVPRELADEIIAAINDPLAKHAAYRVRFRNFFLNKWIRHASNYPVWIIRLLQPEKASYEIRATNIHPIIDGSTGELKNHFNHFSFNSGLAKWFEKHNYYSTREAQEGLKVTQSRLQLVKQAAAAPDPMSRRRALKEFGFLVPFRSMLRFVHCYFVRMGFMDSTPGFHYATMIATYEYWIAIKMREQSRPWREKTEALVSKLLTEPAQAAPPNPAIDVMIPTRNEAAHIFETVANARKLGNVFVLDSGSTDGTQQLAQNAGATVVEHAFTDYAQQKNWGLDNLPFTGQWIFILDADERITPALRREIQETIARPDAADAYLVNRLLIFMGRTIRHGGYYPSWNLRLFRRGMARYEQRAVHEHMVCGGRTAWLHNEMLHIRRESLDQFIAKHIRYADMESAEWVRLKRGSSQEARAGQLFSKWLGFRQWLRRDVWRRMPGRPIWRFLYMYVVRAGFLDGRPGYTLARLISQYEYMITLLYQEKQAAHQQELRQKLNDRAAKNAAAAREVHDDAAA